MREPSAFTIFTCSSLSMNAPSDTTSMRSSPNTIVPDGRSAVAVTAICPTRSSLVSFET